MVMGTALEAASPLRNRILLDSQSRLHQNLYCDGMSKYILEGSLP